ncbi:MAG: xanthine dehydrogenase family protein molybdopterin-binding subunit [SAR324 cluster bacterium]|nr:xanthine dehydrogenase family protein molybdopterin-binding subunit [SAR324 cluster bacterium]
MMESRKTWVGQPVPRKEDLRLLVGRGRFIDDIVLPNLKHAAIVRSPYAHAEIEGIDFSAALEMPGVRGVLTGADVAAWSLPFAVGVPVAPKYYACAVERARYVGEPVAVVVADDRYLAEDALEAVEVDYTPLPPVMDIEAAIEPGAPQLHPELERNLYSHRHFRYGDWEAACREADRIVKGKFRFSKYASTPIETYGVIASYDPFTESYEVYSNYQGPFVAHALVSLALRVPENRMRWIVPADIGGGFGVKAGVYPYIALLALAARKTGCAVKWIEDRQEHLTAGTTGTDRVTELEAAVRADGTILGLKDRAMDSCGGYIRPPEPGCSYRSIGNHTGAYRIRNLEREVMVVATNKSLTGPNRGYTCPQLYFSLERMVDTVAAELGLDPAEVRFRNLVQPEEFPYKTATGGLYDSGDYPRALRTALERFDYPGRRARQAEARAKGRLVGIGMATVVEPSVTNIAYVGLAKSYADRVKEHPKSGSGEAVMVKMDPLGAVHVIAATNPQGQGHETVLAQVVADELGVHPDDVTVSDVMDTHQRLMSITSGGYSSRFASIGTTAAVTAARQLRSRLLRIAAHLLDAQPDALTLSDGRVAVEGAPERSIEIRHVAGTAHWNQSLIPEEMEVGLFGVGFYNMPTSQPPDEQDRVNSSNTYGCIAEVMAIEIDRETGAIDVLKWVSVHDAGTILNPMLLEGQLRGGIAHGVGGALLEECAYDEDGQILTGSFQDYLVPTAMEIPPVEIVHQVTPSPITALGSKGTGEGSAMSAPATLGNAVADALAPLGVVVDTLPLSPQRIWHWIQEAGG